jgi:hypothetical protein
MSFLKFSRDRRGYEHFYLVEAVTGRRGKTRQRVLYWYRTPPNVKVGREPFDPHVMRALEARYPDVRFDWDQIRNTPIPSVEPEYWRERRRAERVVRRLQEDEDALAAAAMPPISEAGPPEAAVLDPATPTLDDHGFETAADHPRAVERSGSALTETGRDEPGSRRRRRRRGPRTLPSIARPLSGERDQTESSTTASIDAGDVTEDGSDTPDD